MTIGVFDLSNYAKRAYHAAYRGTGPEPDPWTNPGGLYASMMKMVLSFIKTDISMVPLTHCLFAIDFAVDSWRKALYPNYKCSRSAPDAEWIRQINFLIDVFAACGLKSKWVQGLEADDLFGVVVGSFPKDDVVIFTNDKDAYQLMVNRRCRIFNPYERRFVTDDDVHRKFGVGPEHIRNYLALNGDSGDDIPGLYKVGPKTVAKIMAGERSVEEWIAQERDKPEEDIQIYRTNFKLAAICTNPQEGLFPWPHLTYNDITIGKPDRELFMHHWCAKGKIDIKPHPLFNLVSESTTDGLGFDDDD